MVNKIFKESGLFKLKKRGGGGSGKVILLHLSIYIVCYILLHYIQEGKYAFFIYL